MSINGCVFYPQPDAGYLRLMGADRVSFIQRQTTNDLGKLTPDHTVLTVLVTPTARILDVLRVLQEGEQTGAITLPGYSQETMAYLKSRIFFMDKVTLEDASAEFYQADLEGEQVQDIVSPLGLQKVPELDELAVGEIAGVPVWLIGQNGLVGQTGYRLLAPASQSGVIEAALRQAGMEQLTAEQHEILRVEAGLPAARTELTQAYTPLETGLQAAVSGEKGCYTGQEVIARQITYDKVTQQLVGLRLEAPAQTGERLWVDGKPAGAVTSFIQSPTFGPIALAVVKRPYFEPGTRVIVGRLEGGETAVVSPLPFKPASSLD